MNYYITNIDWDTNTSDQQETVLFLPEDVVVCTSSLNVSNNATDEQIAEGIEDYLSTLYGFHINGFVFVEEHEIVGGERTN